MRFLERRRRQRGLELERPCGGRRRRVEPCQALLRLRDHFFGQAADVELGSLQLRALLRCGEDSRIEFVCLDGYRRGLERHGLLERSRDGRELRARSLHLRETKSTLRSLLLSYFTHIRLAFASACGRFACRREALVPIPENYAPSSDVIGGSAGLTIRRST